jgi:uncharacterized protein related to proFAR isomerase
VCVCIFFFLIILTASVKYMCVHCFQYEKHLLYIFGPVGQGRGYDLELVKLVSDAVTIPVIASSGAGEVQHFSEVFRKTNASAALAAGIFHRNEVNHFVF